MVETHYKIKNAPRIALLADLHGRDPEPVISSIQRHDLDLIAIAGDVIYGTQPEDDISPLDTQENVLPFLSSCASIAPTYLSLGNHEWMATETDLERIRSTGVVILDNEFITTEIKTSDQRFVSIAGLTSAYVTDYRRFRDGLKAAQGASDEPLPLYPKRDAIGKPEGVESPRSSLERVPEISWLTGFAANRSANTYRICISHHPEYINLIPHDVDLILSGHTHGGQWRYYSIFKHEWNGVWAPGQGWLPRYSKGVYDNRLVVSAGLSNTTWVPRICNPTEVVYINCSN
ncbi:MAG: metallophosphoesterase [Lachnospiraceae bacterium]|nr:metallophosphoesterase [Lachnospiraceae bacterium]